MVGILAPKSYRVAIDLKTLNIYKWQNTALIKQISAETQQKRH